MTKEEIKQSITAREVLAERGISINRKGMCRCPFHGADKHPSMQVNRDYVYCFTCGAHADIFELVQSLDGVSFRDAFISLGGTYEHQSERERKILAYRREQERKKREASRKAYEDEVALLHTTMHASRTLLLEEMEGSEDFYFYLDIYEKARQKLENMEKNHD